MKIEIASTVKGSSCNEVAKLPLWLLIIGFISIIGSATLAGRLIWEQTVWTWAKGPQMVGFSLVHRGGVLLLLFPFLLIGWLLVVAIKTVWNLIKKRRISMFTWFIIGVSVFVLTTLQLPYGFWQRLFANRLATGSYAGEVITYAAATGDLKTVKALLSHGLPIDITDRAGKTGLHAAAVQGQIKVIEYLISKGANINAIDQYGDSPLEIAISQKHTEAAKLLADHGAQRVHGDEQTRQRAIEKIVLEDIQKMEKEMNEMIKKHKPTPTQPSR